MNIHNVIDILLVFSSIYYNCHTLLSDSNLATTYYPRIITVSAFYLELYLYSLQMMLYRVTVHKMDGWMTCDFASFLTVFQSYQDDIRMTMKGCVQWNSVYGREDFTSSEDQTRSARSVGQRLAHRATRAPHRTRTPDKTVYLE